MRIGVDASCLGRSQRTGVSYYTYNLLRGMIEQAPGTAFELAYFHFMSKPPVDLGLHYPNAHLHRVGFLPGKAYSGLFKYLWAPPIDWMSGARGDVYLFPNFDRYHLAYTRKSVVVIHDLAYAHAPEYVPKRLRDHLSRQVPRVLASASAIIAVSHTTMRDIVQTYGVPERRITVASNAVDAAVFKPASAEAVREVLSRYGIAGPYIQFHGTLEPRKNLHGVMAAYRKLSAELRHEFALVLTGGKGWLDEPIYSQIEDMRAAGANVVQTGYVPQEDLVALLSGAGVVVYPSFYEGFGLPVLEAMACGAPVITSNVSSLPEAAGDAGLLVDPANVDEISDAIATVLRSRAVAAGMRERGFAHARKFTWAASAATALALLEDVARGA